MQGMLAMQQQLDNMAPNIERMKLSRTVSIASGSSVGIGPAVRRT